MKTFALVFCNCDLGTDPSPSEVRASRGKDTSGLELPSPCFSPRHGAGWSASADGQEPRWHATWELTWELRGPSVLRCSCRSKLRLEKVEDTAAASHLLHIQRAQGVIAGTIEVQLLPL